MSENNCPVCGKVLALASINVAEGVALCGSCGKLSRLSDVVTRQRPMIELLQDPPRGCSVTEWGHEVIVRATIRSIPGFLGALFICLFWNGIVSVFVLIALAGLFDHFMGPLPPWFPAPDMNGGMPLGMTLFLCVFLIPFVTIGACMFGALLLYLAGKVEVIIGESSAVVRTGIGVVRWSRHFDPTQVSRVGCGVTTWQQNGKHQELVVIEADNTVKFGSLLSAQRREWLQAVLQSLLANKDPHDRREMLAWMTRSVSRM